MPECHASQISEQGKMAKRRLLLIALLYTGLSIFVLWHWWTRASIVELSYAWKGYSPVHFTHRSISPEEYASNYSQGVENYAASLPMLVYPWLAEYGGIAPETTLKGYMLVECILMAVALVLVCRALQPQAPHIAAVLVTILLFSSDFLKMDLARFGLQIGTGLYYSIASSLQLLAIVLLLQGRLWLAWLLLAAAYACHPIMALVGVAFMLAYLAATPRAFLKRPFLLGGIAAAVLVGLWTLRIQSLVSAETDPAATEAWFQTVRMTTCHWMPFDIGVFGNLHHRHILPLLALVAMAIYYAGRRQDAESPPSRSVAFGLGGLVLLTVLGLAFSLQTVSPTLVKLSLHRSSQLLVIVAMVYVVAGLWEDISEGRWWQRTLAAMTLVSPLLFAPALPVLWCLALVAPATWNALRRDNRRARDIFLVAAVACLLVAISYFALSGHITSQTRYGYIGTRALLKYGAVFCILAIFASWLATRWPLATRAFPAVALLCMFYAAVQADGRLACRGLDVSVCRSFLDSQVWARENTPPNTLFMVDPLIHYGWRDFSRRCSFGNLREWIYSWHYSFDFQKFEEGRRRLGAMGIDLDDYLGRPSPNKAYRELVEDVRRRYYTMDAGARRALLRDFGIDYFVMQKSRLGFVHRLALRREFPVAFENEHFLVFAASGPVADPPRLRTLFAARFPPLDGSVSSQELQDRMPPLKLLGIRGRFAFETLSGGEALRVRPLQPDANGECLIEFGYTLHENGFAPPIEPGDEPALVASIRLAHAPKRATAIFIQDKTDRWQRSRLPIDRAGPDECGIAKTIRPGATGLIFGVSWKPDTMEDFMEIRDLKIVAEDRPASEPH